MTDFLAAGTAARYTLAAMAVLLIGCDSQSGLTDAPALPSVPVQLLPADGADDVPDDLALEWSGAEPETVFHVIVASDASFESIRFQATALADPLLALENLQLGGTYWWRVRAVNAAGESDWSETWSFTPDHQGEVAPIPELVSPLPDAIQPLETIVYWTAVPGAVSYDLQVAQEDIFLRMDVDRKGIHATSKTLDNLIHGYEYFWRVRSRNWTGVSDWSEPRRFMVSYETTPH